MSDDEFKPGTRVKFTKGWREGQEALVIGRAKHITRFEVYKVGFFPRPHDQMRWKDIRVDFLEFASVIDKLASLVPEEGVRCGSSLESKDLCESASSGARSSVSRENPGDDDGH